MMTTSREEARSTFPPVCTMNAIASLTFVVTTTITAEEMETNNVVVIAAVAVAVLEVMGCHPT